MKTALIIVDVQNDFLPGGSLAIENGHDVIEPIIEAAAKADYVVASRDWHPADHSSFETQGGIWPVHCVADTRGGALDPAIERIAEKIVDKGCDRDTEAYSAFQGTDLHDHLGEREITNIWVAGLATDYCVKATVLDALNLGYEVEVILDGCRGVDADRDGCQKAVIEMLDAGAIIVEDCERLELGLTPDWTAGSIPAYF